MSNGTKLDHRTKFILVGKCLDRYDLILEKTKDFKAQADFHRYRFDRFIDIDVSNVDVAKLVEADDETVLHDMSGIFANIERDRDCPENSTLKTFVPRVGFLKS